MESQLPEILRQALVDKGVGTYPTNPVGVWPIYIENFPSSPDNCIFVQETTGVKDTRTQPDDEVQEDYGIQVLVRGATRAVASLRANVIAVRGFDKMVAQQVLTVDGKRHLIHLATRPNPPIYAGKDGSTSRQVFSVNALVTVDPVTL